MRSSFVTTAKVLLPSGSTSLAILRLSDVAMSVLAVTTANMIEFGFAMYFKTNSLICCSISCGWSPTGTYLSKTIHNERCSSTQIAHNIQEQHSVYCKFLMDVQKVYFVDIQTKCHCKTNKNVNANMYSAIGLPVCYFSKLN